MIKIIEYSVGKGKGRGWQIIFKSDNKPLEKYKRLCVGFKNEKDRWIIFEVDNKTVKVGDLFKEYIYEANFLGYNPDTTIELDKVEFEWITDEEVINCAANQACYT